MYMSYAFTSRFGPELEPNGPAHIIYIYMYGQLSWLDVRAGGVSRGVSRQAGSALYMYIFMYGLMYQKIYGPVA